MTNLMTVALALLVIAPALKGQELEVTWDNYLNADASLRSTLRREQEIQEQQNRLQADIRDLRENRAWYNGWLVEYMLSRKSGQQLELADSLGMIKSRMQSQQQKKESAFQILKLVYEDILLADDAGESFSASEKEQAVTLGRWLIARSEAQLDLPDYSTILTEHYENEAIRDMVFSDLQVVLRTKLASIDTILAEKRQEIALLNRLNEVHSDLSIQVESDRDIQGTALSSEATPTGSDVFNGNDPGGVAFGEEDSPPGRFFDDLNQDELSAVRGGISQDEDETISLNPDPLYEELNRLIHISEQYQDLLRRLGTELPD